MLFYPYLKHTGNSMTEKSFLWKPFIIWLQPCIKHGAKPTTLSLISGILSDLTRSRSDLIAENTLLRQQLIILHRQVKRPRLTRPDRFYLPAVPSSGNKRFKLFDPIHSCAGIRSCFGSIGGENRKAGKTSQRFHPKRPPSSESWPGTIS